MHFPALATFVSLLSLGAVTAVSLFKGGRKPQLALFVLSALALAGTQASLLITLRSSDPEDALGAIHALFDFLVLFPALALPFFATLGRRIERQALGRLALLILLLAAIVAGGTMIPTRLIVERIHFAEDGSFWGMTFSSYGKVAGICLLLANVFFLFFFENTYRAATVADKVTLKYPFLGLLLASVINFAVLSRMLAIAVVDRNFVALHSCGVIFLSVCFLYASFRYPLFEIQVYLPRGQSPSIVSIVVAGLYLFSLGVITFLARVLGFPFDSFTRTVIGVFAVFVLLTVLISGKAKKRLRTFLGENVYFTRYNYRKEWRRYAEIMASGATIDEFLTNVVSSLCDTMLVQQGLIWAEVGAGRAAFYGFPGEEEVDPELMCDLEKLTAREPVVVFKKPLVGLARGAWVHAVARLGQGEECRGFIVLGKKELDRAYTAEDEDFLATIAFQAQVALDNLLMEERIIESRQMESFSRFASFVVHDLKNTVGMLSLVAENARANIGSAEFQQDALETVRRSVDKMQNLIGSLSVYKMQALNPKSDADLVPLVEAWTNALKPAAAKRGVSLDFLGGCRTTTRIDTAAINRVVENLVLNAIEAAAGGSVKVQVESVDGAWAVITVRDTGPGFDPDYLRENLFRPFHSTKKGGLGVGLILCKSLVEAHGGKITIASTRGQGATVSVMLPALPPARSG